jgi:hypothetical protein
VFEMSKPTIDDIEALIGPSTPHFTYQLRARLQELIEELPPDDPVRRHGQERLELLDDLGYASSRAEQGGREPSTRPGWEMMPSSAPVSDPLPRRQ